MWNPDRNVIELRKKVHDKCRAAVRACVRSNGKKKTKSTRKYVGYSDAELINHLQKFPNWQNLKNTNWELDHIFPIKAFIENKIFDPKLINSLDNLQPLSRIDNLKKSDTYDKDQFFDWLKIKGYN